MNISRYLQTIRHLILTQYFYSFMLVAWLLASLAEAQEPILAFPGAEGFGRFAKGGRGGTVIAVTNLNDSGTGSLRAALTASRPRIVVFRVGGTITLTSPIEITNGFLTIAGQTAPGDGIQVKGEGIYLRNASHVIVRYLRIRPGDTVENPLNSNAIIITGSNDIIIDHSSLEWSMDQNAGFVSSSTDITMQWSIIGEALFWSDPVKDHLSFGMLLVADKVTLHHNLWIHNNLRNPAVGAGQLDFVNNVWYNTGRPLRISPVTGPILANIVANRQINGINTAHLAQIDLLGHNPDGSCPLPIYNMPFASESVVYAGGADLTGEGNIIEGARENPTDPIEGTFGSNQAWACSGGTITSMRFNFPKIVTTDAFQATTDVLAKVGARLPKLDPVDTRLVNDVTNALGGNPTGKHIGSPSEVGGWPTLASVSRPSGYDSDHDGMPNDWETQNGFNANSSIDGPQDADGDGWTNVEEFLNGTNPRDGSAPAPSAPSNLTVR